MCLLYTNSQVNHSLTFIYTKMKRIKFISILLVLVLTSTISQLKAQVAINTDGSAPNASAMLDVTSTDKGILIPRVASTGSITSPVNGLLVYSTADNTFNYYDGSAWKKVSTANSQWTTTGSNIYYNTGGVAIGGGTVNSSAILDLQSTDKGILIPRVAGTGSVTAPVAGLLIYSTTDKAFYYYDGSAWKMINNQWNTSGSNIYYSTGGVTIGGTPANNSAILDLQSTDKGILIPRMTLAERGDIYPLTAGLMIFCTTDNSFYYYNGTTWAKIATGTSSSQWNSSGTDIYYSSGRVAIGGIIDNTPSSAAFDVQSTSKGMLIPRMSEVQRTGISGPVKGLMVYQTDGTEGFYYYTGSSWNMVFSLASGSSLPVAQGGTGIGAVSANQVLFGNPSGTAFSQSSNLTYKNDTLKIAGTLVVNGNVSYNGGSMEKVDFIDLSTTLGSDHSIVLCKSGITIDLPLTSSTNIGKVYTIKNRSSSGTVIISPNGTTIDASPSITLNPYYSVKIVSGGTKWYVLSYYNGSF